MADRVLLVDDEPDFLDTLAERMRNQGFEVDTASSAMEALDLVKNNIYGAIVLDMMMPEMDGIEALQKLKENREELQVILLTGHASVQKGVEAIKLGALDFMEKPADMKELKEKIQNAQAKRTLLVEEKDRERIQKIITERGW